MSTELETASDQWRVIAPGETEPMTVYNMPLWCEGQIKPAHSTCCYEERGRILEIVKQQIGMSALDSEIPEEMPLSFFRELYERIDDEVSHSKRG